MTAKELLLEAMRRSDAGDLDGFVELQGPDCTWITPNAQLQGRDELRGWLTPWLAGFPTHRRHELQRVVEVDGTVYAEGTFHGVNEGSMETPEGTLPPTGRPLAMRFALAVDIDLAAGHATAVRLYFDQLDFLAQLGLLPEPAAS
jgi:ketosteroid isomerase-like protein